MTESNMQQGAPISSADALVPDTAFVAALALLPLLARACRVDDRLAAPSLHLLLDEVERVCAPWDL